MRIPQQADKWIVFVLMLGVGAADFLRGPLPAEFGVVARVGLPLIFGVVFTAGYVLWCLACRGIARLLQAAPESAAVRVFANVSFLLLVAVMFIPIRTHAVRRDLPAGATFGVHGAAPLRTAPLARL